MPPPQDLAHRAAAARARVRLAPPAKAALSPTDFLAAQVNHLLAALSPEVQGRLFPHLERRSAIVRSPPSRVRNFKRNC